MHPSWGAALVDLRLHGDSRAGFAPPHTVRAAAEDVLGLVPALPGPVEALVGHSLGGKVVLAAERASGHRFPRAVVLDASPSRRPDGLGSEQSRDVLALLGRLPARVRDAQRVHLRGRGGRPGPGHRPVAGHGARAVGAGFAALARFTRLGVAVPQRARRGRLGRGDLGPGRPSRCIRGGCPLGRGRPGGTRAARGARTGGDAGGDPRRRALAARGRARRDVRRGGAGAASRSGGR